MTAEDVIAIHQLLALYGHAVDARDEDRLAEVFTDDAVFDATDAGAGVHIGLEAIRDFFARGKPPHPPSHHATNFYAYEEEGEPRALSKWLTLDRATGGGRSGDYADELACTASGWRIRRRAVVVRFFVGASPGWPS